MYFEILSFIPFQSSLFFSLTLVSIKSTIISSQNSSYNSRNISRRKQKKKQSNVKTKTMSIRMPTKEKSLQMRKGADYRNVSVV